MKILITTGIYPPAIGGPAQYAKNLAEAFAQLGHRVTVKTYRLEKKLPTGLRHLFFLIKILPAVWQCDFVLTLDTFSVGWPTVLAGKILSKKVLIRTGGDFLWEGYVERTGDLILLSKFYQTSLAKLSRKERIIFKLTRWTLRRATKVVFSTDWQRQIWATPYQLDLAKTAIVENYYGPKEPSEQATKKNFIFAGRAIRLKNLEKLELAFTEAKRIDPEIILEKVSLPHAELMEKLRSAYAAVIPSVSEVSPNLALEALRYNKPTIMTHDCGLAEQLQSVTLLVDSLDHDNVARKIASLADLTVYRDYQRRLLEFNKIHNWRNIAEELLLSGQNDL